MCIRDRFTTGQNQYDFLDYPDFCHQVAAAVNQDEVLGIINICSGKPEKLADRVERFIAENGLDVYKRQKKACDYRSGHTGYCDGGNLRVHLYPHSAIHRDFPTLGHLSQFSGCVGRIQQCRRAELWRQLHQ